VKFEYCYSVKMSFCSCLLYATLVGSWMVESGSYFVPPKKWCSRRKVRGGDIFLAISRMTSQKKRATRLWSNFKHTYWRL